MWREGKRRWGKVGLCRAASSVGRAAALLWANDFQVKQPGFIKERLKLFETLKTEHQLFPAAQERKNASSAITVRVAGGKTVQGERWRTTPYQVAAEIRWEPSCTQMRLPACTHSTPKHMHPRTRVPCAFICRPPSLLWICLERKYFILQYSNDFFRSWVLCLPAPLTWHVLKKTQFLA